MTRPIRKVSFVDILEVDNLLLVLLSDYPDRHMFYALHAPKRPISSPTRRTHAVCRSHPPRSSYRPRWAESFPVPGLRSRALSLGCHPVPSRPRYPRGVATAIEDEEHKTRLLIREAAPNWRKNGAQVYWGELSSLKRRDRR